MYNHPGAGAALGTAGLAATGMDGLTIGWLFVAGVTLFFAGLAVRNLLPARKADR